MLAPPGGQTAATSAPAASPSHPPWRATSKQHIPFGPFMLAGAFAVILASSAG